ncbi:MAG TPA: cyclase family protein [Acidimicrobiales bacterium]|nr:cyclase family protein [Acidimicrobiales bacterium]
MTTDGNRSNWGRWGADDERGALNLATPELVLNAARALRTGKVYPLGLPVSTSRTPKVFDRPSPERLTRNSPHDDRDAVAAGGVGSAEDLLVMPSHSGTHIDALAHVHEAGEYYNGHRFESFTTARGAAKCSIVRTGSLATRAVMLDVARLVAGDGRSGSGFRSDPLPQTHTITASELEACCTQQQVEVRPGDAVLIRTGWTESHEADRATPGYPQAGIGLGAAAWLQERDVSLVGADNSAVEVLPFEDGKFLCVHVALIVRSGIGLIEHLWLADLAMDNCYESLLVVGALQIVGATGSPVNPIAIG